MKATKTAKTAKAKNIFPKIKTKSGGYTVSFRFMDEDRGERYFDAEWSVFRETEVGSFSISCLVSYDGRMNPNSPAGKSIGHHLRKGDTLSVTIYRWSMRGRAAVSACVIEVKTVVTGDDGEVTITY